MFMLPYKNSVSCFAVNRTGQDFLKRGCAFVKRRLELLNLRNL